MSEDLSTKEWLSPADVSRVLGMSIGKARKLMKNGVFKRIRIDADHLGRPAHQVHREEIVAWAANKTGGRHGRI